QEMLAQRPQRKVPDQCIGRHLLQQVHADVGEDQETYDGSHRLADLVTPVKFAVTGAWHIPHRSGPRAPDACRAFDPPLVWPNRSTRAYARATNRPVAHR